MTSLNPEPPMSHEDWLKQVTDTPGFKASVAYHGDKELQQIRIISKAAWTACEKSQEARIARMRELLVECEFTDNSGGEYDPTCPICNGGSGHKKGCRLKAELESSK